MPASVLSIKLGGLAYEMGMDLIKVHPVLSAHAHTVQVKVNHAGEEHREEHA